MKKLIMFICAVTLVIGMMGVAGASTYYHEEYTGSQFISQSSNPNPLWFVFDINESGNANTNSSLGLTTDASGFDWMNDEVLTAVTLQVDMYDYDGDGETAVVDVDIFWSDADFTITESFDAVTPNSSTYTLTHLFTAPQMLGWEEGGFGQVAINAFDILNGFNDFSINRVSLTAYGLDTGNSGGVHEGHYVNPEPTSVLLMGIGIAGLIGAGARKKLKKNAVVNS